MKVVRGKTNHRTLSMRTNNHVRKKERKAKEFCKTWRMIVWGDGGNDGFKPVIGTYSTKAGKYYGVHVTCRFGDDYPDCGDFGKDM